MLGSPSHRRKRGQRERESTEMRPREEEERKGQNERPVLGFWDRKERTQK